MAGILSKGIKLGYSKADTSTYTDIPNLQEVPDLGGTPDQVDVTVLTDSVYHNINGIKNLGELAFTFLYDNSGASSNYRILKGLEDEGTAVNWQVTFPDGTKFAFAGQVAVTVNGAGVNAALQFTATIALQSDITVTNPA